MLQKRMRDLSLLIELALHEFKAQQRETLFGLVWMVLWPIIQAGGFMLAFSLIRGRAFDGDVMTTYIGVLAWSSMSMLFIHSLGFLGRNADLMKHMVFPFHLIMLNEINVKFVFFAVQLVIASMIFWIQQPDSAPMAGAFYLLMYLVSLYLVAVAVAWAGALLGVLLPDLNLALPPVLMLLLALSPVFHRDLDAVPRSIEVLNQLNPLSHVVVALYDVLGITGPAEPPVGLMVVAVVTFSLTRLGVSRLHLELAKIV